MLKIVPKVNSKKVQGITQYTLHYEVTLLWLFTFKSPEVAFFGCEVTDKPV